MNKKITGKKIPSKPEIAYVLPELSISGGIAIALYHILELRKLGRNAIAIVISHQNNGDWFPYIDQIPVISVKNYLERFEKFSIKYLTATWWETAFVVENMKAENKFYFLQSLENRFYPEGNSKQDAFFLSLGLGLTVFTEAKWIQRWLRKNLNINAVHAPNGLDQKIFYPDHKIADRTKLRVLVEGAGNVFYKGVTDCFDALNGLDVDVWYVSTDGFTLPHWKIDKLFLKIPQSEMRKIYSECDVLLKMSKVEGVFGPPLEMMACGGTCVVGDVTGYDEYCVHEKNCLVVDKDSPEEARSAILRLINTPDLLQSLKNQGPPTARKFAWKKTAVILNKHIYKKKIRKQKPYQIFMNENMQKIKEHIDELERTKVALAEKENLINLVYSSPTWKIGNFIVYPFKKIRNFFRG